MSLTLAAQQLASHGRHDDTELVHMSKPEVAGLHALAQKHGMNLTRNPNTGLVEAGVLRSILPMVAGAAGAYFGIDPMTSGLISGGLGAATSKSGNPLMDGLSAGFGAYAGGDLANSFMASGATPSVESAAAGQAANIAAPANQFSIATTPSTTGLSANGMGGPGFGAATDPYALNTTSPYSLSQPNAVSAGTPAGQLATQQATTTQQLAAQAAPKAAAIDPSTLTQEQRAAAMSSGATGKNFMTYIKAHPMMVAGALAGPLLNSGQQQQNTPQAGDSDRGAMANAGMTYHYNRVNPTPRPNMQGYEQTYFQPTFGIKEGGHIQSYADGGLSALDRFNQLQASREAQKQLAPQTTQQPVDENALFNAYQQQPNVNTGAETVYAQPKLTTPSSTPTSDTTALAAQNAAEQQYVGGNNRYSANLDGPQSPAMSLGEIGAFARENPMLAKPGQWISSLGAMAGLPNAQAYNNAFNGGFAPGLHDESDGGGSEHLAIGGKSTSLRGVMGALHGTEHLMTYANGGMSPGQYNLGSYSDGGRLLRGPGDGVSDDIPAVIGHKQPARLADGEFVVPARIVSEIGNGSTEAGARKLYAMMDRIQAGRKKTIGTNKEYAKKTNAEKHLPA